MSVAVELVVVREVIVVVVVLVVSLPQPPLPPFSMLRARRERGGCRGAPLHTNIEGGGMGGLRGDTFGEHVLISLPNF